MIIRPPTASTPLPPSRTAHPDRLSHPGITQSKVGAEHSQGNSSRSPLLGTVIAEQTAQAPFSLARQ